MIAWGYFDSEPPRPRAAPERAKGDRSMSDIEDARRRAEEDHRRNQQTQMATEQAMRDSVAREAFNAELERQRQLDEERRRQSQG